MIVQKTSVFPAPRNAVFQKLQRLETLQTIAKPYAVFEPVDSAAAVWTVGGKSSYRLRLFGCLIREGTCVESPCCDYCIVGDSNPIAQDYELVKKENGLLVSVKK